jgi:hypothetical protein
VWSKQLHRVIGTGIGLLLSWALLLLPLDKWSISLTMMALAFVIEVVPDHPAKHHLACQSYLRRARTAAGGNL